MMMGMSFREATKKLNIEKYNERIFNSNSQGELFHLCDYVSLAESITDDPPWFAEWFDKVVKYAEDNWNRPESVFQHILEILRQSLPKQ